MKEHNKTQVILDKNKEQEYTSTVTDDIWLYDINEQNNRNNFAEPIHNNSVKSYVQSYDYFQDLLTAMRSAEKEIYITGWQVNWDAMLTPDLRLVDILLEVTQGNENLKIFILPWDDCSPVETYDNEAKIVLRNYINEYIGREAIAVRLHSSSNDEPGYSLATKKFFSHHQKCVIIDRKIAFVGGIDLAYGRYSHGYKLDPNADERKVANRYNPCIEPMDKPKKEITLSFKVKNRKSLKNNKKYQNEVFVEKRLQRQESSLADNQPIMPWQDIQVKIEGKAVFDLVTNFVLRWNQADYSNGETRPRYKDNYINDSNNVVSFECISRRLFLPTQEEYDALVDKGNISVQILRSASSKMRGKEKSNVFASDRKKLQKNIKENLETVSEPQSDIYRIMLKLIKKAKRFIYIENQFFVSDYGNPERVPSGKLSKPANTESGIIPNVTRSFSNTGKDLPENKIVKELSDKIANVIFALKQEPFHIYITLPVHPEGVLNDGSTMAMIHQTMQTISFGSDSLLNRIRKHLWVYQQLIKDEVPRKEWGKMRSAYYDKIGNNYQTIPLEECDKYVTLLNLRSWTQLGDRTVTEQIYVHSKLTIVDDLYVLVGSANINDRSLLGGRDSELAALIVDNDTKIVTCSERGIKIPVRAFAYQLRKQIWQGLYGEGLEQAIEVPELASSVKAIQSRAKSNTAIYESVFPFIPRNYLQKFYKAEEDLDTYASIWPALDYDKLEEYKNIKLKEEKSGKGKHNLYRTNKERHESNKYFLNDQAEDRDIKKLLEKDYFNEELLMPFNEIFWQNYNINEEQKLKDIKGYITLVPIHWTKGENNAIPFHIRLLT
ncbi:phospholipase [Gilliamella sp. B14384G15]|uniref:hypothetical protein n=1 Tax=unclassified Gilliamella TaxID=2685620 RepID=UPI0018DBC764|nr:MULTISPECIES: hypothetical protein [unclassified Gilliamella]MBI0030492.1 phospholipase [Gilliamella sp. B14384G15]MBI0057788.1 phospholipase [Gilliamella sp. B14384G12]